MLHGAGVSVSLLNWLAGVVIHALASTTLDGVGGALLGSGLDFYLLDLLHLGLWLLAEQLLDLHELADQFHTLGVDVRPSVVDERTHLTASHAHHQQHNTMQNARAP
ncbi:MAG: hypothetical protein ACPG9N_06070, partial [Miltoncostaeaceae bacterium]